MGSVLSSLVGDPLWHPGVHFVTLGIHLGGFLWIWGDLGAPLWYPWAPFGHHWGTLAHFLEKCVKNVTNGPPNGTVFGTFSIFLLFCRRYCGSSAETGFWVFVFFRFLWESGKRNMDLTTVFIVPNAHHVVGSRTGASDSEVPSGVSFGSFWIGFWCFFGDLAAAARRQPHARTLKS